MKKSVKIAVLAAAALMILGIVVGGLGFWGMGFNLKALNTEDIVSNTVEITEAFHDISIETDVADLHFAASEDRVCRVECVDFASETYTVNVENGTLTVAKNNRTWHKNVTFSSIGETCVTIYLPQKEYASLQIQEDTGDIEIPADFSFEQVLINTSTGDVCWFASVSEELSITTDTGDVDLRGASPRNLTLKTHTGDVALTNTGCASLSVNSNSGKISLKNVIAAGTIMIESNTGDVEFDRSDAAEIFVQTNTGDVTGTLASDKVFLTETDTGDIRVPKSEAGGRCEILTNTGDMELRIEP